MDYPITALMKVEQHVKLSRPAGVPRLSSVGPVFNKLLLEGSERNGLMKKTELSWSVSLEVIPKYLGIGKECMIYGRTWECSK